ncbi:hypothetical protein THII_2249 [Thioploca ingrica]|uniref:Tc1-like transposase DDE domain-containing protein n=1 Tax=Thioploca ingrica TaxID=40754 RepID=A0A090BVB1_9GAMM|nr:hypothetical protein THII_2249 [Thioploca ingrica]
MNQRWLSLKKKAKRLSTLATLHHYEMPSVHYWCQDESRFGLKTITRRRLTLRGVKPHSQVQWSFKSSYLYGRVEPLTGESFFLEFSHLNTDCFQAYWREFSQAYPHQLHLIQMDNATGHPTKRLIVPENIILWFQPAPSPDCNPIERLWAWLKRKLAWKLFDSLEELKRRLAEILAQTTTEFFAALTGEPLLSADLD